MKLNGRCFCGQTRFECHGEPDWACICHCESCRRNCAAPFTAFFGIRNEKFAWQGDSPKILSSTAGVKRYFCASCGTPMAYFNSKWDWETHFYLSALEAGSKVAPTFHVHWNEKLPWVEIADELPKYPASADDGGAINGV